MKASGEIGELPKGADHSLTQGILSREVLVIKYMSQCLAADPESAAVVSQQEAIPADGIEILAKAKDGASNTRSQSKRNTGLTTKMPGMVGDRIICHDDSGRTRLLLDSVSKTSPCLNAVWTCTQAQNNDIHLWSASCAQSSRDKIDDCFQGIPLQSAYP
jgi:hypothetical protein